MKKILAIAMLCAFTMTNAPVYGQSVKKQLKSERKAAQARVKELSAQGWQSLQSAGLATIISEHNAKMKNNPDLLEFPGTAEGVKTTNIGKAKARNSAINDFAEYCGGMLRARITSDLRDVSGEQADNLIAGYERILAQKIEKDLKPSYYIYKETSSGMYDVRGFFFVDESVAARKSKEALKEAADEAKLAFDYANGISDFIKQGFKQ